MGRGWRGASGLGVGVGGGRGAGGLVVGVGGGGGSFPVAAVGRLSE